MNWKNIKQNINTEKRNLAIAGLLLVVLAFGGFLTLNSQVESRDYELQLQNQLSQGDGGQDLIVFSHYRCPHCRSFYNDTYPKLKQEYSFTVHHINYPVLSEGSVYIAKASECAYRQRGDEAWSYHMKMMTENMTDGQQVVEAYGGNQSKLASCIGETSENQLSNQRLVHDIRLAQSRGYQGTPVILLDGERISPEYEAISSALK